MSGPKIRVYSLPNHGFTRVCSIRGMGTFHLDIIVIRKKKASKCVRNMTWLDSINLIIINYDVPRESDTKLTKPISYRFSRLAGLVLSAVPGKQSNDFRNLRTSEVQTIWIHSENPTISGTWLSKTSSLNACPKSIQIQGGNQSSSPLAPANGHSSGSREHLDAFASAPASQGWHRFMDMVVPKPWWYLKSWISIPMVEKLGWWGGPHDLGNSSWWLKAS